MTTGKYRLSDDKPVNVLVGPAGRGTGPVVIRER